MKSIRAKVIAAIVFCTVLASGLIGCFSIVSSSNMAISDAEDTMRLTCSTEAGRLNSMIARIEQSVDTLSSIVLDELDFSRFRNNDAYVKSYTESIEQAVLKFGEHTEGAVCAYVRYNPDFTDPKSGIFYTRDSTEDDFISIEPTDFSIYEKTDLAHVGWYYIPVENKAPTWMDPYLNENINRYLISYVVPLYVDGESVGIIGMDIDFSQVTDYVAALSMYDTGYAYLTDAGNHIAFHRELAVGSPVAEAGGGNMEPMVQWLSDTDNVGKPFQYSYQNQKKRMVFSMLENGMRLALTVPETEIKTEARDLADRIFFFAVSAVLLACVIGIVIGSTISSPIKKITGILKQTAGFDFRRSEVIHRLARRRDELGVMAAAVVEMRISLRDVVDTMAQIKGHILGNVEKLDEIMEENNRIAGDNSVTTQEIAVGMEETSASTSVMTGSVEDIQKRSGEISDLTRQGKLSTDEVMVRARRLGAVTVESSDKTVRIFAEMQEKTEAAMEQSRSVDKINELTDNIRHISSQTNMLALNANIEAARAGEAGKGFAVVATQIGALANQTFRAVDDINGIVSEVTGAVSNMSDCIEMLMEFLEQTVLADYQSFRTVGEQYQQDASTVIRIIDGIDSAMEVLNNRIIEISKGIENIGTTVEQTAEGINAIAEKTAVTVAKTEEGYQQLQESRESVNELAAVMERFVTR